MAILPALAVSACGGSRLTHDAVMAAVNGGPQPTATAQQQQQGAVSALPQNGGITPTPGTAAAGGATVGGAGAATPVTAATGAVGGGAFTASPPTGTVPGSAPSAARPAGPE
jgi:hypothetical protein